MAAVKQGQICLVTKVRCLPQHSSMTSLYLCLHISILSFFQFLSLFHLLAIKFDPERQHFLMGSTSWNVIVSNTNTPQNVPFTMFDSAMCSHCALNFVIIWLYIHALNLQDIKTPACGAMPCLCFSFLLLQWLSKLLSCPPLSLGNTPCWFSLRSEAWTTKMAPQGRKEMLASHQEGVKSKPKLVKT